MSSAGKSGTSDTDKTNPLGTSGSPFTNTPSETDVTGTAPLGTNPTLDETSPDVVEMIEVVTMSSPDEAPGGTELYPGGSAMGGIQWWLIPAVALPVAGGATFWYLRRRRASRRGLGMLSDRGSDALRFLRKRTKNMPDLASDLTSGLKGRSADLAATIAAADLAGRALDLWETTRESAGDLLARSNAQERLAETRKLARKQLAMARRRSKNMTIPAQAEDLRGRLTDASDLIRDTVSAWLAFVTSQRAQNIAKGRAQAAAKTMRQQIKRSMRQVPSSKELKAETTKAAAKAMAAMAPKAVKTTRVSMRTRRAVKNTRKSVRSAWKRTRAFSFGLLVTAMGTYVAMWRRRMMERTMRETASGRLEPDREPTFSR